jgi:two-component system CheB/CheR fusion protein
MPALEELAGTTSERHPVHCRCEADTQELHCDVTTATHLYRIAQEALNNALKHSGARNLAIRLTESEGAVVLQIKDDGKGLDPASGRSSGMGLHIMDYRARLIGGSLQLQSDRNGTTVSCRVPQNTR